MDTTPNAQADYIAHELTKLTYQLQHGNRLGAATAARTMQHELGMLLGVLDSQGMVSARVATTNGVYRA